MVSASIPPEVAFEPIHPKYTPPPNSPPFDEHVVGQALKWSLPGCLISGTCHSVAHLIFGSKSSPHYQLFDSSVN